MIDWETMPVPTDDGRPMTRQVLRIGEVLGVQALDLEGDEWCYQAIHLPTGGVIGTGYGYRRLRDAAENIRRMEANLLTYFEDTIRGNDAEAVQSLAETDGDTLMFILWAYRRDADVRIKPDDEDDDEPFDDLDYGGDPTGGNRR